MDVRVRCCSLTKTAADNSLITETAINRWLASEDYKRAIEGHLTLGYMSHRGRNLDTLSDSVGNTSALKKTVGKDDAGLIVSESAPTFTHYVKEFYVENVPNEGPWLCAVVHILDEDGCDEIMANNIKRLKSLIRQKIALTCSLVVVAYWEALSNGIEITKAIKTIKSLDWTVNPSFGPLARIIEVMDDEKVKEDIEKEFSEKEFTAEYIKSQPKEGELKVKTFSNVSEYIEPGTPKSSKIDGKFTKLKVKQFSCVSAISEVADDTVVESQKEFTQPEETQKEFTQARVREELREMKLGLRMSFRRCLLSYRQAIKSMGGVDKIDPEDLKILKSMLSAEVLMILNQCTQAVIDGKQINTLLGTSSISKNLRVAGQHLQLPLRMAHLEAKRQNFVTKQRYQKLQAAYIEFSKAIIEEVFGPESDKMNLGDENDENNGGQE